MALQRADTNLAIENFKLQMFETLLKTSANASIL